MTGAIRDRECSTIRRIEPRRPDSYSRPISITVRTPELSGFFVPGRPSIASSPVIELAGIDEPTPDLGASAADSSRYVIQAYTALAESGCRRDCLLPQVAMANGKLS